MKMQGIDGWQISEDREVPIEALSIGQPCLELVGVANIENPVSGHLGAHRDGRGVGVELEVGHGVSVRGEDNFAPLINGESGEIGIEVLATRKAVDLDRYAYVGTCGEDILPTRPEPWAMVEVAAVRVGQNMHTRSMDRADEALGLIAVGVELAVNRGHHAFHLEAFSLWHIEGAIRQDFDLETLEHMVVLSMLAVPSRNPPLLQTNALEVETGGDLEPA